MKEPRIPSSRKPRSVFGARSADGAPGTDRPRAGIQLWTPQERHELPGRGNRDPANPWLEAASGGYRRLFRHAARAIGRKCQGGRVRHGDQSCPFNTAVSTGFSLRLSPGNREFFKKSARHRWKPKAYGSLRRLRPGMSDGGGDRLCDQLGPAAIGNAGPASQMPRFTMKALHTFRTSCSDAADRRLSYGLYIRSNARTATSSRFDDQGPARTYRSAIPSQVRALPAFPPIRPHMPHAEERRRWVIYLPTIRGYGRRFRWQANIAAIR